jgi:cytochrome b6-f complex iron-sulfur subunit
MEMKSQTDQNPISRRKLMIYAWVGAAVLVIGELIGGTFAFLWPRRRQAKGENVFIAGKVSDFKKGEVIPFRKEKAFIVRTEEGFLAISAVCPHLHCIVNWNEVKEKFECPCHGAKFNRVGDVLEGPPPRALDLYKLEVVQGNLVIDKTSVIERKTFNASQVIKS